MANRFIGLKDALQFILNGDNSENEFGSEEDESDDNFEPDDCFRSDDGMGIESSNNKARNPSILTPEQQQPAQNQIPHVVLENDEGTSSDEELQQHFVTVKQTMKQKRNYRWHKKEFNSPTVEFKGEQALPPADGSVDTPLQHFNKFITDEMVQLVAENTNLYSVQKNGKSVATTTKEIEQVFGMFFRMGIVCMPGIRVYWENETRYDPVASVMSRNRFQLLLTLIHFVDNLAVDDDTKKADKLWKIRPWLDIFRSNCLKITGEEKNSIDEMMVSYKGSFSGIKQYMRGKPHPWGFKIWCRTGVKGMLYDFDV